MILVEHASLVIEHTTQMGNGVETGQKYIMQNLQPIRTM